VGSATGLLLVMAMMAAAISQNQTNRQRPTEALSLPNPTDADGTQLVRSLSRFARGATAACVLDSLNCLLDHGCLDILYAIEKKARVNLA
jgi:hypothetical protein